MDNSLCNINFNENYNIYIMSMPNDSIYLRTNYQIQDIFHFNNKFADSYINGEVYSLIYEQRRGQIVDLLNEDEKIDKDYVKEILFNQEIDKILHLFKLIRLVTNAPIFCTEIMTRIIFPAWELPDFIHQPKAYNPKKSQYMLNDKEIELINQLQNSFPYNIDDEILNLLLLNYDYSFYVPHDVAILNLVTCLEMLYHPGDKDELKFRIARNAAVFLGIDEEHSKNLFDEIKMCYDIRSSLIHTGKFRNKKTKAELKDKEDVVNRLRKIVSSSILKYKFEIVDNQLNRQDFFNCLNYSGFGNCPYNKYITSGL